MPDQYLIVGGGVIGCAIAYNLASRGARVTLLERASVASEASGAAAGLLAPIAESRQDDAFLQLAVAGLRAFQEESAAIESAGGIAIEYAQSGIVRTAETAEQAAALRARIAWAEAQSLPVRWYDAPAVHGIVPALGDRVIGGLYSPEEGHVNPGRLTLALAQAAARRGATIHEGAEVDALVRAGDAVTGVRLRTGATVGADRVVLAGGAWTRLLGRGAIDLPVAPVHGQYLILRALPQPFSQALYGEDIYLVPRPDGTIYAGATEEPERGYEKRVTVAGVRGLLNATAALTPVLEQAEVVRAGSGLRPGAADHLPLLGAAPGVDGLTIAAGHFRNGILLSLITGRLMAESLLHGRTSIDLAPFSPARFLAGSRDGASDAAGEA
jgi:glycine oxidase